MLANSGSCSTMVCETSSLWWAIAVKSHGEFASSDAAAVPRSAKSKLRWSHLGWATSKAIIGGTKINNDCTCSDKTTTAKRSHPR